MKKLRKYGNPPHNIILLHGGPGAQGEMAPVAKEISAHYGVLEPIQHGTTISAEVKELNEAIKQNVQDKVTIIGYSWGAWLGWIFTARHPEKVKKLILVSSGPFEARYAKDLMKKRMKRLTKNERIKAKNLLKKFKSKSPSNQDLDEFGDLMSKADTYKQINNYQNNKANVRMDIYNQIWPEAAELRKTGKLINMGKRIKIPVIAIHGEHDSHPAKGVEKPLQKILDCFKFIEIPKCGHTPWKEQFAKQNFYQILLKQIGEDINIS